MYRGVKKGHRVFGHMLLYLILSFIAGEQATEMIKNISVSSRLGSYYYLFHSNPFRRLEAGN